MGFDAQAFATAFLEGQATDIKARLQEAREEGKRKKELARTAGMSQWKKRKSVANVYKNYVEFLSGQGMTPENLNYLVQNPKSLVEAHDAIKKYSETHRGSKLDADTINSMVDMSTAFVGEVGEDGKPLELDVLIKKMSGLYIDNHKPTSSDPNDRHENLLSSLLGLNATERANIKLQSQMVGDKLSMLDLYDMGAAGDYVPEQLAPVNVNVGLIPQPLTDREMAAQRDDFFGQLEILLKEEQLDLLSKNQTLSADKEELLDNLQNNLQIDSTRMRLSNYYGDQALANLYAKGGFYKNIFDNPLVWDADNRARNEAAILGQDKVGTGVGGAADGGAKSPNIPKFTTQSEVAEAIYNKELKENDVVMIGGTETTISEAMVREVADVIGEDIKGSSRTTVSLPVSTESIQNIFNNAAVEKRDYGMGAAFEIATLPELSVEEKRATDAYIASLKEEYEGLPTKLMGGFGGRKDRKIYKGKSYGTGTEDDFKNFLRTKLKEEFPDVVDSLIQELVGMY